MTHDYTRKGGIVHAEIMLPAHAPPEFADRSILWNSVEQIEKARDSQLAREIEAALPRELSDEQQLALVRAYVKDNFVDKGMCADFAIHDKGTGNPHVHIMLTLRPLKENGQWGAKCRKAYDLDENGQRIPDGKGGWKNHREDTTDWNDKENVEIWRAAWAAYTNRALESAGRPERIDHRSYKRQGIDKIPSVHLGPAASQMEKRGIRTDKGEVNRQIAADNKLLKEINKDREGLNLQNVEIQAYASPEGGFKFNDKLAGKRQNVSEKYVKDQLKKTKMNANIDAHYTAQDWDGFQRLVQASNLQDKDVILRVLSMYKDPEEREQQIRNMSAAFRELADGILPELRRSRLIINYETIGRSDDQIQEQYNADAAKLSADELLYFASLQDTQADQEKVYKKTAELYDKDYRAYNNLAEMAFKSGNTTAAKQYLAQALQKNAKSSEANANLALLSLVEGNTEAAEQALGKAAEAKNYKEVLGNLNIAKGNYAQAAQDLAGVKSNSAALAQILNKDYAAAAQTLATIAAPDATTSYLKAILSARTNQNTQALANLKDAFAKDASLKARAAKDLDFAKLFGDATFQSLIK